MENEWKYGIVLSEALNVRKQPCLSAERWNGVWPLHRIALVKPVTADWYETIYRGEPAYVSATFIATINQPLPASIVTRMMKIAISEIGRSNSSYFNGYGGKWYHRFADWLPMHAGIPRERVPDVSNCGRGIVWFAQHGCFYFKNAAHKIRMIRAYPELRRITNELTLDEQKYIPAAGDYIYFRWSNAASSVNVSHVGIVRNINMETLTTFEGNVGKKVVSRMFHLNDERIVGYGHPNYPIAV